MEQHSGLAIMISGSLARRLYGKLFGDKGCISHRLAERLLLDHGLRLITRVRKNMRNVLMDFSDKLLEGVMNLPRTP